MSVTRHLDLRTGTPVWTAYRTRIPRATRLKRSAKTDVLVVGAGISGILMAHALARRDLRVVLVDRRGALHGSTSASTALLQFELDQPLVALQRKAGVRVAKVAWQRSLGALRDLRSTIFDARVPASVRPSVYLAGPLLNARAMQAEVRARSRIGLPSHYLSRAELRARFGLRRGGAIVSYENMLTNPVALSVTLLRQAMASGVKYRAPHDIVDIDSSSRRVVAGTADGFSIESRHIVLCTGYEMPKLVPMSGHSIRSTWAMATAPQPKDLWPELALIWEAASPYLYVRVTDDGRIICGGEDEPFSDEKSRDERLGAKTRRLQAKLHALLPSVETTAEFAWTGSFGENASGLPMIGTLPGVPRCHAVMGYGGNGITFSTLAAQMLSDQLAGKRDPDAKIFAFH